MKNFSSAKIVKNILKVYFRATDADLSAGLSWYQNAYLIAEQLNALTKSRILSRPECGAGIIAAFSPMVSWKRNLELASALVRGVPLKGMKNPEAKAQAILNGAYPLDVLKGPKVRAFYSSIVTAGATEHVVIDRHALSIALGRNATEKERSALDGKIYEQYSRAYRSAALKAGLRVSDLQAVCWVCWRREKGIVD